MSFKGGLGGSVGIVTDYGLEAPSCDAVMGHTGPVTGSLYLFYLIYVICQWQCRDTKWTAVVIFNSTGLELHTVILEVVSNLMGENGMFEVNFYAESCSITLHFGKKHFIYLCKL